MFLEVENINFGFTADKTVLDNVSFCVEQGETLAIVGASGSGKSTLLRLLAAILQGNKNQHFSGNIKIEDKTPATYVAGGGLSFMFQEPTLMPNLSVFENINLPLKISRQPDPAKVNHLIDLVGLKGFQKYLPSNLSGGMKTRVSMARAFITAPSLLLLDEPFSSLDIAWRDALYSELRQLKAASKSTVVLVTHDIEEALELGDNIICLGIEGKILLNEKNTKSTELRKLLEQTIIRDHQLRKFNETKYPLYPV